MLHLVDGLLGRAGLERELLVLAEHLEVLGPELRVERASYLFRRSVT